MRFDLFETNRENSKGRERNISVREILILLASVLALAASIAKDYSSLPTWYLSLVAALLVLAVLSVLPQFVLPALQYARTVWKKVKQNRIARKILPGLIRHIEDFGAFVEQSRYDNVHHALREISQAEDFKGKFAPPSLSELQERYLLLKNRIARFDGTREDLQLLAREFDTLLYHYVGNAVSESLEKVGAIGAERIPERLRKDLRLQRENLAAYIRSYVSFGKGANDHIGGPLFRAYLEIPKEI